METKGKNGKDFIKTIINDADNRPFFLLHKVRFVFRGIQQ